MRRLVDKISSIVELDDIESIAIKDRFHNQYPLLERAIQAVTEARRIFPDRFSGMVSYNNSIAGSRNFQIPEIFSHYQREIFFVGINRNFLVNLRSNPENFAALLNSLARDPARRARILVADLWDSEILHAYDKIVFGSGMSEFAGLNEVFTDPSRKSTWTSTFAAVSAEKNTGS